MTGWQFQELLWKFLPADRAVSFTMRAFGGLLVLCAVAGGLGIILRRRWLSRAALVLGAMVALGWAGLYAARPAWLRIATRSHVPMPEFPAVHWETRAPGLETADVELRVENAVVDRWVLTRLDPHAYRLSVHWAPAATRTAEEWQRELHAAVVVSGTYFGHDFVPLTPLRCAGRPAGPMGYQSTHGAFVSDGRGVDILDLRGRDVSQAIGPYPEAMVSYPLLIDPQGENRAFESKTWLASRNFIALDESGHVILGTTETGFFTLRRLGDFLKASPLGLRMALNFDGGPLVSQIVRAGNYARNFHGKAEISDGSDVLRVFWHTQFPSSWPLPIVLVAMPVASAP